MSVITSTDHAHLRETFRLARQTAVGGNRPFAALLADREGRVLARAMNTGAADRDCTAHAEMNLIKRAYPMLGREAFTGATIYASAEPCVMCAGAIYWSGARRLVFGIGIEALARIPTTGGAAMPQLRCEEVLTRLAPEMQVFGRLLEAEAAELFAGDGVHLPRA